MEYFFNELSIPSGNNTVRTEIHSIVETFVRTSVNLKGKGFTTLRSYVHISQIEIEPGGITLGSWLKENPIKDREILRKFKALDNRTPAVTAEYIRLTSDECHFFSRGEKPAKGLAAAYLRTTLSISFASHTDWDSPEVSIEHEYLEEGADDTIKKQVSVKHVSCTEHIEFHHNFILNRLKAEPFPKDWVPSNNYLPNAELVEQLLDISGFYQNLKKRSRPEQIAEIRLKAREVAELNYYTRNEHYSKKNRSQDKIRDIYESPDGLGKKVYLSVDVEKGAFEVCDEKGTHVEEILFNGQKCGDQRLDHSIKLE